VNIKLFTVPLVPPHISQVGEASVKIRTEEAVGCAHRITGAFETETFLDWGTISKSAGWRKSNISYIKIIATYQLVS
jgi:hypothetical protein